MKLAPYLGIARRKFETLSRREKILALFLTWAVMYGLFYLLFFHSLEQKEKAIITTLQAKQTQLSSWNSQISVLMELKKTPQYKQWLFQQRAFNALQRQYKALLQTSQNTHWQSAITDELHKFSKIKLVQMRNLEETVYNPTTININNPKIYEQKVIIVFTSDYFDTIAVIQSLEKRLPYVHWDRLHYQVAEYPFAKVEMELAVIYEKKSR